MLQLGPVWGVQAGTCPEQVKRGRGEGITRGFPALPKLQERQRLPPPCLGSARLAFLQPASKQTGI